MNETHFNCCRAVRAGLVLDIPHFLVLYSLQFARKSFTLHLPEPVLCCLLCTCAIIYAIVCPPTPLTLRAVLDQNLLNDDAFLYEESPDLLRFRTAAPSIELLTDWYQSRAEDIEQYSRQVFTADHREIRITWGCSEENLMRLCCYYPVEVHPGSFQGPCAWWEQQQKGLNPHLATAELIAIIHLQLIVDKRMGWLSDCRRPVANLHQRGSLWFCLWWALLYLPYGPLMKSNQICCHLCSAAVREKSSLIGFIWGSNGM